MSPMPTPRSAGSPTRNWARAGDSGNGKAHAAAAVELERAAAEMAAAEIGLQQMTEAAATGEARRSGLERRRTELAERQSQLKRWLDENEAQRRVLNTAVVPEATLAEAEAEMAQAVTTAEAARAAATSRRSACKPSEPTRPLRSTARARPSAVSPT